MIIVLLATSMMTRSPGLLVDLVLFGFQVLILRLKLEMRTCLP